MKRRRWRPLAIAMACSAITFSLAVLRPYPKEQLVPHASLVLTDRHGAVLRRTSSQDGGKLTWVPVTTLPPLLVTVLLESEDRNYFEHSGVDWLALVRSMGLNLQRRELAFGGSTMTMQAVRLVRPHPRTVIGKLVEIIDALRLERAASKQAILEQYLNRAYFGHGAVGVEAASQRYFGHDASQLTNAEASLLAVLVRGPRVYDLVNHLDRAVERRDALLNRLVERSLLTSDERDRISAITPAIAHDEPRLADALLAPHFVDWILGDLSTDTVTRGGTVTTTLDLPLQRTCERLVRDHTAELSSDGVGQAGLVVLDAETGEVRAMVGSRDYADPVAGMVNITTTARHPGSSLKPFTYALALETGDTPATLATDVIDGTKVTPNRDHNADGRQHGPVRYRHALASSYNLSALDVARKVGPVTLLQRLREAGLTTLEKSAEHYGAELTLGSGAVRLVDLAAAYRFVVADGRVIPAHGVARIVPAAGVPRLPETAPRLPIQLFDRTTSWLIMDMLSDARARRAAFGDDLPVDLPFPVAVKTGTSGGFSDNVMVIATREYIVAAWAGNFDGKGMHQMLAMWGAGPLARRALLAAANGRALTLPPRPDNVHAHPICALSGMAPGPRCPLAHEHFADGTAPQKRCTFHDDTGHIVWPARFAAWADRVRHAGAHVD